MPNSVWVLGTYDQPTEALFDVDLMQWLAGAGVPVAGVVFKRSAVDRNPHVPAPCDPLGDGRVCLHVRDFNDQATVSHLRALGPGLLIYAGGRDIFRQPLLDTAPLGMIGGHYGQLPQIRGMGTVEWSVMLGVPPTVAIQRISPGIDTGDILLQARVPLVALDTFTSIRDRSYFMTKVHAGPGRASHPGRRAGRNAAAGRRGPAVLSPSSRAATPRRSRPSAVADGRP